METKNLREDGANLSSMETEYVKNLQEDVAKTIQNDDRYGELISIGYHDDIKNQNCLVPSNKFVLFNRSVPNGLKLSTTYKIDVPYEAQVNWNTDRHSIVYSQSYNQATVVEFGHDKNSDMFQIGRQLLAGIDIGLFDEIEKSSYKEAISRFSCRIMCNRNNPSVCRIYAAGFNSSKNIFLGPSAKKWETENGADGFITNGVLIMYPKGSFSDGNTEPGIWYEVSVSGTIYSTKQRLNVHAKQNAIEGVTNVLQDGTLIQLSNVILIWRSAEGLKKIPTKKYLEDLVNGVNNDKSVCPISFQTLIISPENKMEENLQQPFVNLACGHVQGTCKWYSDERPHFRTCPLCMKIGKVAKLQLGYEPSFYVDREPSSVFYAFDPCGHMTTEKTAKYWIKIFICPFCPLPSKKVLRSVRLIFN